MAKLPLKASRNEQCSVIRFLGANWNWKCYCTHYTLQIGPPVTILFFGSIKKMLGGQKFASDTEVQSTVRQWLRQQSTSFIASGIQKLVHRWNKCLKCLNGFRRYVVK